MEKKELKFWLIIIFLIIDIFTIYIIFMISIRGSKTIKVTEQNSYIVKEIQEKFNIDYDIKEIKFRTGFPDGYYLDIYEHNYQAETVFDNDHTNSSIYNYFKKIKNDSSIYVIFLIIELLIEVIIFDKIKEEREIDI